MRDYHFYKLDMEARRLLAEPPEPGGDSAEQQVSRAARIEFLREYNLPELQHRVPAEAAREVLDDYEAGRLPAWALRAVKLRELRAAAGG